MRLQQNIHRTGSAAGTWRVLLAVAALALCTAAATEPRETPARETPPRDAAAIIQDAIEYWRDVSSYSITEMIIHRPTWERAMTLRVWTRGQKESLVRVTEPAKDAGNGTLLIDNNMWTYTPKINRVIKVPSSMMSMNWMGSDFSNNDLAKADDLIEYYSHRLIDTQTVDGHTVYHIESIPHEDAPVVWGKEVVQVRDDLIVLEHAFYDQDMVLVKKLSTLEIKTLGGKAVASVQRMQKIETPEEWTQIGVTEAQFGVEVSDYTFTLANLRQPVL